MAEILKGAPVAARILEDTARRAQALRDRGISPKLAILRVGQRPDDMSYERAVIRASAKAGVELELIELEGDCTQAQLMDKLDYINGEPSIHGCLMFRPLPPRLDEQAACEALRPEKDLDAMGAQALGGVFTGKARGFAPCTAQAVLELLDYYGIELKGKEAVVLGRSLVIGRPLAMLLLERDATVTVCHSRSRDLPGLCRRGEILISAMGRARAVGREHMAPGQVLIDVGVSPAPEGGICGDLDFQAAQELALAVSPVPGGVGSVTAAVLLKHTVQAAEGGAG